MIRIHIEHRSEGQVEVVLDLDGHIFDMGLVQGDELRQLYDEICLAENELRKVRG